MNPLDPMTSYEQAEAEADECQDEARREQHYAEAEYAARDALRMRRRELAAQSRTDGDILIELGSLLSGITYGRDGVDWGANQHRQLRDFEIEYGTPALLRVIANALEQK